VDLETFFFVQQRLADVEPCLSRRTIFFSRILRTIMARPIILLVLTSPWTLVATSTHRLRNGIEIPLVGLGCGNQDHERIVDVVKYATSGALPLRLIDTAMKSQNAELLMQSPRVASGETMILTKVWYTHLGYERTKLVVEDEIRAYGRPLDVVLLHWPRCNDQIRWMECDAEELALPQRVRDAGPAKGSFLDSWRALEDLYSRGQIRAIGVSNFKIRDLKQLLSMRKLRTKPHVMQGTLWSALFEPQLMALLKSESIFYQSYGVLSGTVGKAEPRTRDKLKIRRWVRARNMLRKIAVHTAMESIEEQIARLHEEKTDAAEAENYDLAKELKGKAAELEAIGSIEKQIAQLHKEKIDAAEAEDYDLAKELKGKAAGLEATLAAADFARGTAADEASASPMSIAQVIQRWLIQRGIGIIPRATSREHVDANAAVRTLRALSVAEMRAAAIAVEQLVRVNYGLEEGSTWGDESEKSDAAQARSEL